MYFKAAISIDLILRFCILRKEDYNMYFDSHSHYDDARFDNDRDELLTEMHNKNVDLIVNSGESMISALKTLELTEKYPFIYGAVGIHPHNAANMKEYDLKLLKQYAAMPKIVAIGEIGLDFYYDNSPRDIQRSCFKKQLALAKEIDMPVIIHSREASQECFDIIKASGVNKGVIHCYSGSWQMAQDYINMGFYIGIGGVLTYSNARRTVEVVEKIPLDKIVIETDCPYLAPIPMRGKRNNSMYLEYVAEKISQITGVPHKEVASITTANAKKLFSIQELI